MPQIGMYAPPGGGGGGGKPPAKKPANNGQEQPQETLKPPQPCYSGDSLMDKSVRFFSLVRLPQTWEEWVVGGASKIAILETAKAGAKSAGGAESLGVAAMGTAAKGFGLAGTGAIIVATMADIDCHIGPVEPYTKK